jgi:hypothetical protein
MGQASRHAMVAPTPTGAFKAVEALPPKQSTFRLLRSVAIYGSKTIFA